MIAFLQPLISLLIGIALSIYGLSPSSTHYPGTSNFYALWQSLPALSSVFIFMLGLAAVACGLGLVLAGVQGIRRRYRQIDRAYSGPRRDRDSYDDEDGYGAGVYR